MKKLTIFLLIVFFILAIGSFFPTPTLAQTPQQDTQSLISQLQEQIKLLQQQVTKLQAEVSSTKTELELVKTELKFTKALKLGTRGEEVTQLQEFLKQFPDIYPQGLVTGYFGPLTEAAVRKFQEKQGIESIGVVGPKTLSKLNELVIEGAGKSEVIPPGLLIAPGVQKKIDISTTTTPVVTPTSTAPSTGSGQATTTPAGTTPATPATPTSVSSVPTVSATPAISATPAQPAATATSTTTTPTTTTPPATTTDTATPVISNVRAENITSSGAQIKWTTDILAQSKVSLNTISSGPFFGINQIGTCVGGSEYSVYVTEHCISVYYAGLSPSTTYYYKVRSISASFLDGSEIFSDSNVQQFTTLSLTTTGTLSFSQSSFSVTYTQGTPLPSTQNASLTFTNTSNVNVNYKISVPNKPAWLNSGYATEQLTATPGLVTGLGAYLDPATVAATPGTYTTNIIISGNFSDSPKTIPVTLTVIAANTSTATTTSSLNSRSKNLSAISQMLNSLDEILKQLSKILK